MRSSKWGSICSRVGARGRNLLKLARERGREQLRAGDRAGGGKDQSALSLEGQDVLSPQPAACPPFPSSTLLFFSLSLTARGPRVPRAPCFPKLTSSQLVAPSHHQPLHMTLPSPLPSGCPSSVGLCQALGVGSEPAWGPWQGSQASPECWEPQPR